MLIVSKILYGIGVMSIVDNRGDVLKIIMSVELMLVGVSMSLLIRSMGIDDVMGEVMSIIVMSVAAGESAIGLGILVTYYRIRGVVEMSTLNLMQG